MTQDVDSRIDALVRRDRVLAVSFTAVMWASLVFVYVVSSTIVPSAAASVVLVVSLLALGAFNTASIIAMIRVYAANRSQIYRPDILNLDRNRRARARGSW